MIETVRTLPAMAGHTFPPVHISEGSDYPDQRVLAVTLCDPSIENVDAPRPVATSFAKAIKTQPWADEEFAVCVGKDWLVDGKLAPEQKLKDADFQMHLWNGKPSGDAENKNWEVMAGDVRKDAQARTSGTEVPGSGPVSKQRTGPASVEARHFCVSAGGPGEGWRDASGRHRQLTRRYLVISALVREYATLSYH